MQSTITKTTTILVVAFSAVLLAPCLQAAPATDVTVGSLRLRAANLERSQSWLEAAAAWQNLQDLQPDDVEAFRQRVLVLGQAGAAHLAYQLSQQRPALFSIDQQF